MKSFFSSLWAGAALLVGTAAFLALMLWVARNHSRMWRRLAASYAGPRRKGAIATRLETVVIAGRGTAQAFGHRQYSAVKLALFPDGLSAWAIPIPPLNVGCPPLFLPFAEMTVAETDWMLWTDPAALRMRRSPEIDVMISRDTLRWIREHIDASPFGLAP
ncbi:MAG TPA: hypothetical protein VHN20_03765 [Beijerinckiaceae bacterium]|nr:hypothetical protein [Beijerinckiaceae bacterium]